MEDYNQVAQKAATLVTTHYSSSFGSATKAFAKPIRQHIYNIYGLVRVADEIVDSYKGQDMRMQLDALETEVYAALQRGYSSNIIVHAFQITGRQYGINKTLLAPFFSSMRTDINRSSYDPAGYQAYIHGSAEVIGLMCLKVFVDAQQYVELQAGAAALGAAFQKVNFLRDMAEDYHKLGRFYFPRTTFETFDEIAKQQIITDTRHDFETAKSALQQLPKTARAPVLAAYRYFYVLLQKLEKTPVETLKAKRIRISDKQKLHILSTTIIKQKVGRQ